METKLPENFTDKVMNAVHEIEPVKVKPMGGNLWRFGIIYASLFGLLIILGLVSNLEFDAQSFPGISEDNFERFLQLSRIVFWVATILFFVKTIELIKKIRLNSSL